MNYTNLASLTATVRARMNLTNVNQVQDSEIQLFLVDSCSTFYEMLVSRWRDYYSRSYRLSLVAGKEAYDIPEDFRADVAVFFNSNGQRTQLQPFNTNEYANLTGTTAASSSPVMYAVWGEQIIFTPAPTQSLPGSIEWRYVPQYKAPASPTIPISRTWPNGWERWVVFDTCVSLAARTQQAQYFAIFSKERDVMEAKVMAAAAIRSESPLQMTDVYAGTGCL